MSPQARAARFFNESSSGWARPVYINRHPQPPAKYIRFSEISKSLYTRVKIRLTASGLWDIVGSCPRLMISRCNKFVKSLLALVMRPLKSS